jgi:hypothetical protein
MSFLLSLQFGFHLQLIELCEVSLQLYLQKAFLMIPSVTNLFVHEFSTPSFECRSFLHPIQSWCRFLQFFIILNRKLQSGVVDTPVLRVLSPVSSPYGGDTKKLSIYPARVRMEESQDRVRVHSSVSRR